MTNLVMKSDSLTATAASTKSAPVPTATSSDTINSDVFESESNDSNLPPEDSESEFESESQYDISLAASRIIAFVSKMPFKSLPCKVGIQLAERSKVVDILHQLRQEIDRQVQSYILDRRNRLNKNRLSQQQQHQNCYQDLKLDSEIESEFRRQIDRIKASIILCFLGDTDYGSCCIDEVCAQHYDCSCIVVFGRPCRSALPSQIPTLYVPQIVQELQIQNQNGNLSGMNLKNTLSHTIALVGERIKENMKSEKQSQCQKSKIQNQKQSYIQNRLVLICDTAYSTCVERQLVDLLQVDYVAPIDSNDSSNFEYTIYDIDEISNSDLNRSKSSIVPGFVYPFSDKTPLVQHFRICGRTIISRVDYLKRLYDPISNNYKSESTIQQSEQNSQYDYHQGTSKTETVPKFSSNFKYLYVGSSSEFIQRFTAQHGEIDQLNIDALRKDVSLWQKVLNGEAMKQKRRIKKLQNDSLNESDSDKFDSDSDSRDGSDHHVSLDSVDDIGASRIPKSQTETQSWSDFYYKRNAATFLMQRYMQIDNIKKAKYVGLLIATLSGNSNSSNVMNNSITSVSNQLETRLRRVGKSVISLCVGKLNPAKLCNFEEVEVWVVLSCPERIFQILSTQSEYPCPFVTPYEVEVALGYRSWSREVTIQKGGYVVDLGAICSQHKSVELYEEKKKILQQRETETASVKIQLQGSSEVKKDVNLDSTSTENLIDHNDSLINKFNDYTDNLNDPSRLQIMIYTEDELFENSKRRWQGYTDEDNADDDDDVNGNESGNTNLRKPSKLKLGLTGVASKYHDEV